MTTTDSIAKQRRDAYNSALKKLREDYGEEAVHRYVRIRSLKSQSNEFIKRKKERKTRNDSHCSKKDTDIHYMSDKIESLNSKKNRYV